jgi:hypothetical protein
VRAPWWQRALVGRVLRAEAPRDDVSDVNFKQRLFGRPFASHEEQHQLLPKRLALPVFASDPLSSVAYATEEAMLVLALAGVGAFALLTPISLAIAALLLIVTISYRQTIRA